MKRIAFFILCVYNSTSKGRDSVARVTVQEISAAAGVSIATVSRVLSGKNNVAEETTQRVLETARQLGYQAPKKRAPHAARRNLIGVLVPFNSFYTEVLAGIDDVAVRQGYTMFITQVQEGGERNAHIPPYLERGMTDGLIVLDHTSNAHALLAKLDPSIPVVLGCEYDEALPYPYVAVDDYAAAYSAVNYLHSIGRRRIAMLNLARIYPFANRREAGFRDALSAAGLPTWEGQITYLPSMEYNESLCAATELFACGQRPDAIFCVSDICAAAVLRAARRNGIDVPSELAVIGFDNREVSAMCDPPLTTVHQPRYEIGKLACSTLLRMIAGQPPLSQRMLVDAELIVRGST